MIRKPLVFLLVCFVIFCAHVAVASSSPTDSLRPTLEGVIDVIRDPNLAGVDHKKVRREKVMAIATRGFDFTEMSKRALGAAWRDLSQEERQYFEELFTKLLENAYIGKLEGYSGQEIVYQDERIKGNRAAVATIVKSSDTAPFSVSYVMLQNGSDWLVYDLNIEGVSFLRNYSEQFKSILRKDKFAGLVKILEEKNETFEKEESN